MTELDGCTVAITAERRAEELATLLERRGATVIQTPAIHVLPLVDDSDLRAKTLQIIDSPPDLVVISTGIGFRGWLEAAQEWTLGRDLLAALGRTRVIARGPKAMGAIRGAGLREEWSPATESSGEVFEHLSAEGIRGVRIAVQLHGTITEWEPLPDLSALLTEAGADVLPVSVYRWIRPPDQTRVNELLTRILDHDVDAVTFTSAPAVSSILSSAKESGRLEPILDAFRGPVVAMCVGPVTAAPLEALGVPTMQPPRARLGSLAKFIIEELPKRGRG